jgi:tRNA threonylcarbamoyladenosine biosynthesis protein TsaB
VLACDTSARRGGVAIARGGELLGSRSFEASPGHSKVFLSEVEGLLRSLDLALADIDRFAAVIGPGSFTGLRVSLASMRGLAANRPCTGALASDVVAHAVLGEAPTVPSNVVVLVDLFHGEVFGGVYRIEARGDPIAERLRAGKIADVLRELGIVPGFACRVAGSGALTHRSAVEQALLSNHPDGHRDLPIRDPDIGASLAVWASRQPGAFRWTRASEVLPFYLRDPLTRALPVEDEALARPAPPLRATARGN